MHVAHRCRFCDAPLDLLTWEVVVESRIVRLFAWVCPTCDGL